MNFGQDALGDYNQIKRYKHILFAYKYVVITSFLRCFLKKVDVS
jgi:hypothetical protein